MQTLIVESQGNSWEVQLLDTPTAKAIQEALPLEGTIKTWGDEIYFEIGLDLELENEAQAEVEAGDVTYWPMGQAFCIFFGPTPASTSDKPVAFSAVNVFGKVTGSLEALKSLSDGSSIKVHENK